MGTLTVRNEAQKILFLTELRGQFSDGAWENSGPMDHWVPWSEAEVVVGTRLGRDFYAAKDNYNLVRADLLEWVGDRMVEAVRTVIPNYTRQDMMKDLRDLKKIMKLRSDRAMAEETLVLTPPVQIDWSESDDFVSRAIMGRRIPRRTVSAGHRAEMRAAPPASVSAPVLSQLSELVQ